MSEQADLNGAAPAFDLVAAKAALVSSSTSSRIAQLRTVCEKISQKGMYVCTVLASDLGRTARPG